MLVPAPPSTASFPLPGLMLSSPSPPFSWSERRYH